MILFIDGKMPENYGHSIADEIDIANMDPEKAQNVYNKWATVYDQVKQISK